MVVSEEAEKAKPKKPLNTYMRFSVKKLQDYKDKDGKKDLINRDWKALSEAEKNKLAKQVEADMEQYVKDLDIWRAKFKINPQDQKRAKSKPKKNKKKDQEEQTKPQTKTKGDRKTKEEKSAQKKEKKKSENKKQEKKTEKSPSKSKAKK